MTTEHLIGRPRRPPALTWPVVRSCLGRVWTWIQLWRVDTLIEMAQRRAWAEDRMAQDALGDDLPIFADRHAEAADRADGEVRQLRERQAELEREVRG